MLENGILNGDQNGTTNGLLNGDHRNGLSNGVTNGGVAPNGIHSDNSRQANCPYK